MIGGLFSLVSKFIPDATKAKELEAKIAEAHNKALSGAVQADKDIRMAEMKKGGISAIWRPLTAMMLALGIFLRIFIYPALRIMIGLFNLNIYLPELEPLPLEVYGMLTAFISIYAYGRSMEKKGRR